MNDERPTDSTDPWEAEMSREFDQRVRDLHEAPLSFENVRGKAMTIRRNRRIAVAGSVLAAAAVVVPVAVLAGTGVGDSDGRQDFATNAPSPSQALDSNEPTSTPTPAGTLGLDYLEGTTWHRADGSTVELGTRYDGGTVLEDELLGVRNRNGRLTIDVVDGDGDVTESIETWSYPVADDDRTTVAYVARGGSLTTRSGDDEAVLADGFVNGDSVAAVLDDRVYVTHGDGSPPEVVDEQGNREVAVGDAVKLNDVSQDGRIAAQVSSSIDGSCSAVVAAGGGAEVETCEYSFDDFSPDGAYLSGTDAYRDGLGPPYAVILDPATGDELARIEADGGFVREWVWEDSQHLLATIYEQGEWRVFRFGVRTPLELVLSSSEGDDMSPPFLLLR